MKSLLFITIIAGVIGTGFGGGIGAFFGYKSEKSLSNVLGFASGVMLAIVCFDLIPESLSICIEVIGLHIIPSIVITICSMTLGILMVMLINVSMEKTLDNGFSNTVGKESKNLNRTGWIVLIAIAIHNLPEGMAIGSGGFLDSSRGIALALLIAIHNIPEGMSISCPLIAGGCSKFKGIMLSAISGVSTILGGVIGFLISGITPLISAICVIFAGGAMIYVTFGELLPQSIKLNASNYTPAYVILGITIGLAITYVI
jgi:ZIP family zinc transporter